jgi:hypothetical protein
MCFTRRYQKRRRFVSLQDGRQSGLKQKRFAAMD